MKEKKLLYAKFGQTREDKPKELGLCGGRQVPGAPRKWIGEPAGVIKAIEYLRGTQTIQRIKINRRRPQGKNERRDRSYSREKAEGRIMGGSGRPAGTGSAVTTGRRARKGWENKSKK